jgi:hypothetical protein
MSIKSIDANNSANLNIVRSAGSENIADGNDDFSSILNSVLKTTDLDQIFEMASKKYNVPVSLLKAVAKAESNFNPKAVSGAGAQGIMQLMPSTAKGLGVTNPFDAEQNIMGGAKYLSQMLQKYDGNTQLALAAYNAGPGNISKYGGIPPFTETQNYVTRVMGYCDNNFTAGTVLDRAEKANASDAGQHLLNTKMTAISNDPTPNRVDDTILMEISRYQLQKSLLLVLEATEDQSEDDI